MSPGHRPSLRISTMTGLVIHNKLFTTFTRTSVYLVGGLHTLCLPVHGRHSRTLRPSVLQTSLLRSLQLKFSNSLGYVDYSCGSPHLIQSCREASLALSIVALKLYEVYSITARSQCHKPSLATEFPVDFKRPTNRKDFMNQTAFDCIGCMLFRKFRCRD